MARISQPRFTRSMARLLIAASLALPELATAEELHHLIAYGQSVSVGLASRPVISTVQRHNSLMFNGGVRTRDGGTDANTTHASLAPLTEASWYWFGETPTAGTLEMINDLHLSENGIAYDQSGQAWLGSAPGISSQAIKQLQMGSAAFQMLLLDIYHGNRLATAENKDYRVSALTWIQGEGDYKAGTSEADYLSSLETLRLQVEWAQSMVNSRTDPIPMIGAQIATHPVFNLARPSIALAHLGAARTHPNYFLAAPMYMFDYIDSFHLTPASSKWLGAYLGLTYKRVALDGKRWQPVQPLRARAYGRVLLVNFNVPKPPLVFDTTQVTNPGSYGFRLVDSLGAEIPIVGLAVASSGTSVWISAAHDIPHGSQLRYAWNGTTRTGRIAGARGNLRDSQGDTLVFDPSGINKRMDNWCVIFEQDIETPLLGG